MFCDCFASNLFSKLRYPIFINPINCKEKIIITIPATILKISEFCKSVCPKQDADAPSIIKTVEKPKQNKIKGNIIRITDLYTNYKKKKRKDINPTGFAIGDTKLYLTNIDGKMIIADLSLGNVINVEKVARNFISRPFIFNQNLFIIKNGSIIQYN